MMAAIPSKALRLAAVIFLASCGSASIRPDGAPGTAVRTPPREPAGAEARVAEAARLAKKKTIDFADYSY